MTVSVYISAGAEGRMRGGFHARETLARFPGCASVCPLTEARMGVSGGKVSSYYGS